MSPSKLVGGVDDAGRGAILGPLVIAGLSMREDRLEALKGIGVRDSKLLSPEARERLSGRIREVAEAIIVERIEPEEIDRYVLQGKKLRKLNYLEAMYMARVIDEMKAGTVYVDASDVDPMRFREDIILRLSSRSVEVVSSHHAESRFPVVAGASIIAKVERDREVGRIRQEVGDFGSGYPADSRTRNFLASWLTKHGAPPSYARRSWKTWRKLGWSGPV